jgi:hypothetical protein
MKRHKHAKLLETIVHHIQLFKDTIHLYKVKAHAGIHPVPVEEVLFYVGARPRMRY